MKQLKRILALILVLVMFLGDLGIDNFMTLSAYADEDISATQSAEADGADTQSDAPAEDSAAEESAETAQAAAETQSALEAEQSAAETQSAPEAEQSAAETQSAPETEQSAVAQEESASVRTIEGIALDKTLELSLEGILPEGISIGLDKSDYELKKADERELLYKHALNVTNADGTAFTGEGSYILTLKGESIRAMIEDGSIKSLHLIYDLRGHEAKQVKAKDDTVSFKLAKLELFVLYLQAEAAEAQEQTAEDAAPAASEEETVESAESVEDAAPAVSEAESVEAAAPAASEAETAESVEVAESGEEAAKDGESLTAASAREPDGAPNRLMAANGKSNKTAAFNETHSGAYATADFDGTYRSNKTAPSVSLASVADTELLTVLDAWSVSNLNNQTDMSVSVKLNALPALAEGESLAFYGLKDAALDSVLKENLAIGDDATLSLNWKGVTGVALVKRAATDGEGNALRSYIPADALFANDDIYLTGKMPKNGVVEAVPVTVEMDGVQVLAAYDITIYANAQQQAKGHAWQPAGDKVQVHLIDEALRGQDAVKVFHLADGASEPEYVATVPVEDGAVSFEAESFSTYIFTTLTKTITASDGNTYKVTVEYDETSGIPQEAELKVVEITPDHAEYQSYLDETARAVNLSAEDLAFKRLFDISILGKDGTEYQPDASVSVTVELLSAAAEEVSGLRVLHFGQKTEELSAQISGNSVSFETDGFSVFDFFNIRLFDRVIEAVLGSRSGTLYENDDIVLSGKMPALGVVEANPVSVTVEGREALVAYDIKIYANELMKALGIAWQPTDGAITVRVKSDAFAGHDGELLVYHMADADAEPEYVTAVSAVDSSVTFEAQSFSIYPILDGDGENARIGYRFWYFNGSSGEYEEITTQYFRYQDVRSGSRIYDPGIPGIGEEEAVMIFEGWHKGTGVISGSNAPMETVAVTVPELNDELEHKAKTEFVEGTIIDIVAKLKTAYYITYVDLNPAAIIGTDLVVKEESGDTYFSVKSDVTPTAYADDLKGWKLLDEIADPDAQLYKTGFTYVIEENITLAPVIEGGYWLVFDDNDMVDDGTGRMVSGGASYTPPHFYLNNSSEQQPTVEPATEPEWVGYSFGGWYEDAACTTPYTFGEPLSANTTVYAKWTPAESSYTVIIWKQRATDAVNLADDAKSYDFDSSYPIDTGVKTGDLVYLDSVYTTLYGENGSSGDADQEYFAYNGDASTQYIIVKANGGSVFNVYYDRVPITLNFYTWGRGYVYTETTLDTGTQYGIVNGQYVPLTRADGAEDIYSYSYSPAYVAAPANLGSSYTQYGIIDGEYKELDPVASYSFSYNQYNTTTSTSRNITQFALVDGEYVQLTRHGLGGLISPYYWTYDDRNGNETPYSGTRYTQSGNSTSYTGTRYTRSGSNAWNYQYAATSAQTSGLFGVDDRGGHVSLTRSSSQNSYYYNGIEYTGTRYYAPNNNPVSYSGTLYTKDDGAYHVTSEDGYDRYGKDGNDVFRPLTATVTHPKLWTYTDPETGETKYYTGTRYTRSTGTSDSWQLYDSFVGLYGSTFADNSYTWPTNYDWYDTGYGTGGNAAATYNYPGGSTSGIRTTFMDAFIQSGGATTESFYGRTAGGGSRMVRFWKQNLDDDGYTLANSIPTTGGSFSITDKYEGFKPTHYSTNGGASSTNLPNTPDSEGYYARSISYNNYLDIYFDRINYTLQFFPDPDTGAEPITYSVPYGKQLTDYANQNPGQKSGHYFLGWYADSAHSVPFDFSQQMPAAGVPVFGYWRIERFRVVFVPGADNVYLDPSQALSFRLDYDERISGSMLEAATRPGYTLDGWYTDSTFTNRFLFSTPVNSSTEGVDMTYQTAPRWTSTRANYGDDAEKHSNVRGILVLYAHWVPNTSEKGVNIVYDAGAAALYDGMGYVSTRVPVDPRLYQDGSSVVVGSAPTNYSPLYIFDYWEIVDADGNVVTVEDGNGNSINSFAPGTTFNVDWVSDENAFELTTAEGTGETLMKTIKLRAKYTKSEEAEARYTTITYDGNTFTDSVYPSGSETLRGRARDGSQRLTVTLDKEINSTIILPNETDFYLDGYELAGWSFFEGDYDTQIASAQAWNTDNPDDQVPERFELAAEVAADNLTQNDTNDDANTLYAMWQPKTYTVKVKQVIETGVPDTQFTYSYKSGVENVLSSAAAKSLTLNGSTSVVYTKLTATPAVEYQYYGRLGHVFRINAPTIADSKDYAVRVSAAVVRDDGTRETLPLNGSGNYEILGDVEITFTYSLKVPVTLEKRALNDKSSLRGSKFVLTPVQWNSETQRWDTVGTSTFEFDMSSVSSLTKYLQEGVYRVNETQAPQDYAMMGEPVLLTVRRSDAFLLRTTTGTAVSANVAELTGTDSRTLTIYDRPIRTVTITKTVKGYDNEPNGYVFSVQLKLEGSVMKQYDTVGSGLAADTTNNNGVLEIRVKNGESKTLRIPWGSEFTVTEKEYAQYWVKTELSGASDGDGDNENREISFTIDENVSITYTNIQKPVAPTGYQDDTKPYIWMLGAGVLGLLLAVSRRRKRGGAA